MKGEFMKDRDYLDDYDKAEIEYFRLERQIQQEADKYSTSKKFDDSNYDNWKANEDTWT